jgi:hypothetical protein
MPNEPEGLSVKVSEQQNDWFRVEVTDQRGQIVAIESEMLAGRDIGDAEHETICTAIRHLSGFIGNSELGRENTRLRNAIIDVLDRLEPEESASLEGESYKPNLAMSVCSTLREAIGERA